MATDGVKIIDSDTAHDIYRGIMDLYDSGATFEAIRTKIPFPLPDDYDDFDYEIYTTAYALAAWEIGAITDDILQEVKKVIDKGACVKGWTEDYGVKAGKQRQKELDKLWQKITSTNTKVRKRKKYETIDKLLFDINDVLAFQLEDRNYYATVLLNITQYRGACTYKFGKILFKGEKVPTIEEITKCEIIGRKIPSGAGMDMSAIFSMSFDEMQQQGGIEALLKREAERTGSYIVGMNMTGIDHKDLVDMSEKFTRVGNLQLKEECKQQGSLSGAVIFEELTSEFQDLHNYIKAFGEDTFKIVELIKE